MPLILTVDENDWAVTDAESLIERLRNLTRLPRSEVWLQDVRGVRRGFEGLVYRILGLGTEITGSSLGVLMNGAYAAVLFVDDAGDECVATVNEPLSRTEQEFALAHGERETFAPEQCTTLAMAEGAMLEFYRTGKRPEGFTWIKSG